MALTKDTLPLKCPEGLFNLEDVTSEMLRLNAVFQEKITDPVIISSIKQFLLTLPGVTVVRDNIDTLVLFMSPTNSFLSEFSKGCSETFYHFDPFYTIDLLHIIGKGI